MPVLRTAIAAVSVAVAVASHPVVRAAIRNAPLLVTPKMRAAAAEATLNTAFRAGVLARKIVRR
jgi:hypothetical protein